MNRTLPTEPVAAPPDRSALLSALVDGESDADGAGLGCRLWREDSEARATWHAYQLIGDVLRSEELAAEPGRDQAFLLALRARLADEPVVLAPSVPVAAASGGRERRWITGAAVAAGFAALAGVVVVARVQQADPAAAPALAAAPAIADVQRVSAVPASAPAPTLVIDGHVIRDARLDAYFEAHRGAVMTLPSAVPGGGLRNVDVMLPQR